MSEVVLSGFRLMSFVLYELISSWILYQVGRAGRFGTKGLAITFVAFSSYSFVSLNLGSVIFVRCKSALKWTSKSYRSRLTPPHTVRISFLAKHLAYFAPWAVSNNL
jgi:hypothetical protein